MHEENPADIDRYLDRIGYRGDRTPTSATLRALQRAHLYAVPFENLDIVWGTPIRLERDHLFDKIVTRRRGGFCYELNGLLAWLLAEMGFEVANLSAGAAHDDGNFGPPFDHLVLRVRCPADADPHADWLVDVGWGETFRDPLRLTPEIKQQEGQRVFWLEPEDDRLILYEQDAQGEVERHYAFTREEFPFAAFAPMCHFHQSSDSHFTHRRTITLAKPDGRISLRGNRMIVTRDGERTVTEFTEEEFPALLWEHFRIRAP